MFHVARLALAGLLLTAAGCVVVTGSGELETQTYSIDEEHTEISVCCGFQLELDQGEPQLSVRADDNILDEIVVHDEGDRLVIEYERSSVSYYPSRPVRVRATLAEIDDVEASGGAEIEAEPIEADFVDVLLSGGSRADFHELEASELVLGASGGSHARLTGKVGTQTVTVSGGSVYEAFGLRSESAYLEVSGGSVAEVDVHRRLEAEVSGGSQVLYDGNPRVVRDVSGGSTLRSVD
jgi:hypothetical protein